VRDLDLLTRLAGEYERLYPRKYAPRWLQREVEARVQAERARLRPDERYLAPRAPPAAPLQLELGL